MTGPSAARVGCHRPGGVVAVDNSEGSPVGGQAQHKARFVCPYPDCGRSFTLKRNLSRHMKIHTGVKEFKCTHPGCTAAFLRRSDLKTHMITHSQEKPFVCAYAGCGKRFARLSDVRVHERRHEKNIACIDPSCKLKFCRKADLRRHVLRVHPHLADAVTSTRSRRVYKSGSPPKTETASSSSSSSSCRSPSSPSSSSAQRRESEGSGGVTPPGPSASLFSSVSSPTSAAASTDNTPHGEADGEPPRKAPRRDDVTTARSQHRGGSVRGFSSAAGQRGAKTRSNACTSTSARTSIDKGLAHAISSTGRRSRQKSTHKKSKQQNNRSSRSSKGNTTAGRRKAGKAASARTTASNSNNNNNSSSSSSSSKSASHAARGTSSTVEEVALLLNKLSEGKRAVISTTLRDALRSLVTERGGDPSANASAPSRWQQTEQPSQRRVPADVERKGRDGAASMGGDGGGGGDDGSAATAGPTHAINQSENVMSAEERCADCNPLCDTHASSVLLSMAQATPERLVPMEGRSSSKGGANEKKSQQQEQGQSEEEQEEQEEEEIAVGSLHGGEMRPLKQLKHQQSLEEHTVQQQQQQQQQQQHKGGAPTLREHEMRGDGHPAHFHLTRQPNVRVQVTDDAFWQSLTRTPDLLQELGEFQPCWDEACRRVGTEAEGAEGAEGAASASASGNCGSDGFGGETTSKIDSSRDVGCASEAWEATGPETPAVEVCPLCDSSLGCCCCCCFDDCLSGELEDLMTCCSALDGLHDGQPQQESQQAAEQDQATRSKALPGAESTQHRHEQQQQQQEEEGKSRDRLGASDVHRYHHQHNHNHNHHHHHCHQHQHHCHQHQHQHQHHHQHGEQSHAHHGDHPHHHHPRHHHHHHQRKHHCQHQPCGHDQGHGHKHHHTQHPQTRPEVQQCDHHHRRHQHHEGHAPFQRTVSQALQEQGNASPSAIGGTSSASSTACSAFPLSPAAPTPGPATTRAQTLASPLSPAPLPLLSPPQSVAPASPSCLGAHPIVRHNDHLDILAEGKLYHLREDGHVDLHDFDTECLFLEGTKQPRRAAAVG